MRKIKFVLLTIFIVLSSLSIVNAQDEIEIIDQTETNIIVTESSVPICQNGLAWLNPDGTTTPSLNSCFRANGMPNSDCCASGYYCNGTYNSASCLLITQPQTPRKCSEFLKKSECEDAEAEDIPNSINVILAAANFTDSNGDYINFCSSSRGKVDPEACILYSDCGCKWDNTKGCVEKFKTTIATCDADNIPVNAESYQCYVISSNLENLCSSSENVYRLNIVSEWRTESGAKVTSPAILTILNSGGACINSKRDFACPQTEKIPFFTAFNLMISLGIVFIVYFVFRNKKNLRFFL